jgi:hypothetical protein
LQHHVAQTNVAFRTWRGDEVLDVGPGGTVLVPRYQVHTFKNIGSGPGRLQTVILPAGFECFFEAVADGDLGGEDMDEITALAAGSDLEILAPPPA